MGSVPIIDIAPLRRGGGAEAVGAAIDRACREIGFLVVTGHGVDPTLSAAVRATATAFFDLDAAEKRNYLPPAGVMRGYAPMGQESVTYSIGRAAPPDLNESFAIGPLAPGEDPYFTSDEGGRFFAANIWPERPAGLREAWSAYYREMQRLAGDLMRGFALGLGLPPDFFADKIDRHISRLRVRDYPAQATAPLPGQLRAGAHTDHGSLTILQTEDKPGGLQVFTRDGRWDDVPVIPHGFIVNIGDLMARWTNDRWISTLHRVVNPPGDAGPAARRQSLVFFHNPNYDAVVECLPTCLEPGERPKHAPTTSGAHLARQFQSMQLAPAD